MKTTHKLDGIEAGRGIAALLVVLFHAQNHIYREYDGPFGAGCVFAFGHAGVDFFFVLSGFLIFTVHQADIGQPHRALRYLRRRLTRIYPFYWFALACALCAIAIAPNGTLPTIQHLVWSALLVPTSGDMVIGVEWTLMYEIVFYLAFLLLIVHRALGIALFSVWAGAILLQLCIGLPNLSPLADQVVSEFNLMFLAGMAAAYAIRRWPIRHPLVFICAGYALLAGLAVWEDVRFVGMVMATGPAVDPVLPTRTLPMVAHAGYAASAALILIGLVSAERSGKLAVPAPLRRLGEASYSLYLTHLLAIGGVWHVAKRVGLLGYAPPWIEFLALVASAVIVALLVNSLVEKPLTRWSRRLVGGHEPFSPVHSTPIAGPVVGVSH